MSARSHGTVPSVGSARSAVTGGSTSLWLAPWYGTLTSAARSMYDGTHGDYGSLCTPVPSHDSARSYVTVLSVWSARSFANGALLRVGSRVSLGPLVFPGSLTFYGTLSD